MGGSRSTSTSTVRRLELLTSTGLAKNGARGGMRWCGSTVGSPGIRRGARRSWGCAGRRGIARRSRGGRRRKRRRWRGLGSVPALDPLLDDEGDDAGATGYGPLGFGARWPRRPRWRTPVRSRATLKSGGGEVNGDNREGERDGGDLGGF